LYQQQCSNRFDIQEFVYYYDGGSVVVLIVTAIVQLFIILSMIFIIIFREHPYVQIATFEYLTFSSVGALISTSVTYWLLGAESLKNCGGAIFFFGLGIVLWISPLVMKEFRIYYLITSAKRMKTSSVNKVDYRLLFILLISLVMEIVIDVLWVSVTTPDTKYGFCLTPDKTMISLYIFVKIALLFFLFFFLVRIMMILTWYPEMFSMGLALLAWSSISMTTLILLFRLVPVQGVILVICFGSSVAMGFFYLIYYSIKVFQVLYHFDPADAKKAIRQGLEFRGSSVDTRDGHFDSTSNSSRVSSSNTNT